MLDAVDAGADTRSDSRVAVRVRGDLQARAMRLVGDRGELFVGVLLRTGRASSALRLQLQWMREIEASVPLTAEQRARLTGYRRVLVPLPR